MKLQDQVCTLEQAKRLKELGVNGNIYSWLTTICEPISTFLVSTGTEMQDNEWPAFTVAELGEMLPNGFKTRKNIEAKYRVNSEIPNKWICSGGCLAISRKAFHQTNKQYDTEAQARAEMLIYLLENKLIDANKVNQRLFKFNITF